MHQRQPRVDEVTRWAEVCVRERQHAIARLQWKDRQLAEELDASCSSKGYQVCGLAVKTVIPTAGGLLHLGAAGALAANAIPGCMLAHWQVDSAASTFTVIDNRKMPLLAQTTPASTSSSAVLHNSSDSMRLLTCSGGRCSIIGPVKELFLLLLSFCLFCL
jgi:hypothetical protein